MLWVDRSPKTSVMQGSMSSSGCNGCCGTFEGRRDSAEVNSSVFVFLNVHAAVARIADAAHAVAAEHTDAVEQALFPGEPAEASHEGHLASERHFFETTQRNALFLERLFDGLEGPADEIPPQIHLLVACERIESNIAQRVEESSPPGMHRLDGERIARKENVRFAALVQRLFAEGNALEQSGALFAEAGASETAHFFEPEEVVAHDGTCNRLAGGIHKGCHGLDVGCNVHGKTMIVANPDQIVVVDSQSSESSAHGANPTGVRGPMWTALRRTVHDDLLSLRAIEERT